MQKFDKKLNQPQSSQAILIDDPIKIDNSVNKFKQIKEKIEIENT